MPASMNAALMKLKTFFIQQKTLAFSLIVGFFLLIIGLYLLSTSQTIRKSGQERTRLVNEVTQTRQILNQVSLEQTFQGIPTLEDLPSVLTRLNELGNQHQVQFLEVSPGVPVNHPDGMVILPIELRIEGEYRALGEFFGTLHQTPHLGVVAIRRIRMEREPRLLPKMASRISLEIALGGVSHAD